MSHSKHQRWFSLLLVCFMLLQLAAPAVRPAAAQGDNTQRDTLPQSGSEPPHDENNPTATEESSPATPTPDPQPGEPNPPTIATPELLDYSTESVEPTSPLTLGLTADQTTLSTGETVRLSLSMTNSGDTDLDDFIVGIYLPPGLNLRTGSLTFDEEFRLAWTRPQNLAVGATKHIDFKVKIESGAPPSIVVTAAPQSYKLDSPEQPELELTITDGVLTRAFTDEDEGGWVPQFVNPVVATFSGAATYEYPIEVPPGRNGLQPSINLSYNSKRVDGMLNWEGSEWVGLGWNIDVVDIVRTNVRYKYNTQWITYGANGEDTFQLILNGTSYRLIPTTPGQRNGRYYADSAPDIYIERINDCNGDDNCSNNNGGSRVNKTTEYWIVKTSNGTTYRLGYEAQSEQVLYRTPNCDPSCDDAGSPYSGPIEHNSAYRWRVDLVTDVYGNEMKYEYVECRTNSSSCALYTTGPSAAREVNSYLSKVYYNKQGANWLTQIELVGENKSSSGGVDSPPIFKPRRKLTSIKILWDGVVVKEYDLEYDSYYTPSSGLVLLLTDITPYGLGGMASGSSLPGPSFGYQQYINKDKCCPTELDNHTWANEDFEYERLVWAENGYGGRVEFDYENDGRGDWWIGFYNYRVSQKRVYDGLNVAAVSIEDYDYGSPCYDQWNPAYGTVCTWPNNPDEIGALAGHTWTEITLTGANGVVQKTKHYFHTDSGTSYVLRGRESQTDYMAPDSTLLQRDTNTFGINTGGVCEPTGLPANYRLACLREAGTTTYDGANTASNLTNYWYDPSYQDGTQYGQVTAIRESTNGTAKRTIRRWYNAVDDGTDYLILQRSENLYQGASWNLISTSWYYYDGAASPVSSPGDHGALTRMQQVEAIGSDATYQYKRTTDLTYSYDAFGNIVAQTSYTGYGEMRQELADLNNISWVSLPTGAMTTTTVYDPDGLYPVASANALGMVSTVDFDDDFPWLPAAVTTPSGATTRYIYDDYGRLERVFYPESNSVPDLYYRYYDTGAWPDDFDLGNGTPLLISSWRKTDPEAVSIYDESSYRTRAFYDGLGRLVQTQLKAEDWDRVQEDGHEIIQDFRYDARGLQLEVSLPYEVEQYIFNEQSPNSPYQTPSPTTPYSQISYDALGRVIEETNPDGTTTTHVFSIASGTAYKDVIDANRHRTQYGYDPLQRLVSVNEYSGDCDNAWAGFSCSSPNITTWTSYADTDYSYDLFDNLVMVTDTDGITTTMSYDTLGRKIGMVDPDMGAWVYDYDASGNLVTQTDSLSRTIGFSYDELGRLEEKDNGAATLIQQTYDGEPSRVDEFDGTSLPAGWATNSMVSVSGGQLSFTGDGSSYNTMIYRADTWSEGNQARFQFKIDNASAMAVFYIYSGTWGETDYRRWGFHIENGHIHQGLYEGTTVTNSDLLTDFSANTWYEAILSADGEGHFRMWVQSLDDPSNAGAASAILTNWNGRDWKFVNQLKTGTENLEFFKERELGTLGMLLQMDDPSGSTEWDYDIRGRVVTEAKTIDGAGTYTTTYGYDAMDRVVEMTYPSGEVVTSTYNPQGLPESLSGWDDYLTAADYNIQGQPTAWSLGNSLETTFSYNALNSRLLQIQTGSLLDLSLDYDPAGNITSMQDYSRSEMLTYDYDDLDRLTEFDLTSTYPATVTVRARANTIDGSPIMQLRVNDSVIDEWVVESTSLTDYSAQAQLSVDDEIEVVLLNGADWRPVTPYNKGVAAQDDATGSGYLMYSEESVHTRFSGTPPHEFNPDHFIAVRLSGSTWQYDSNSAYVNFTPRDTDVLVASVNFTGDTATDLEGQIDELNGIQLGYQSGDLTFTPNVWDGVANPGEFTVGGTWFVPHIPANEADPHNYGVACLDSATGSGYVMYSEESVHTRFSAHAPEVNNSDHFICVQHQVGGWVYDNNLAQYSFTPRDTDVLVASVDFSGDTITDLKGQVDVVNGIQLGYQSGVLTFTPNVWEGVPNSGEFTVGGTWFVPNVPANLADPLNYGVACLDSATGSGYVMYSEESVHTRFSAHPPEINNADHFICVQHQVGGWVYDDNLALYSFTPRDTDVLVASVNFTADTISSLEGQIGTVEGIANGYLSGDLTYQADIYEGVSNDGEFVVNGSGFVPRYSSGWHWPLIVDYVQVDEQTLQAEGANVVYDRGRGEEAFDGENTVAGQETLYWAGALRFNVNSGGWRDQRAYTYSPTGNITSKSYYSATTWLTDTYSYNATVQTHAVRGLSNGWSFDYDSNGNMTTRSDGSGAYLAGVRRGEPARRHYQYPHPERDPLCVPSAVQHWTVRRYRGAGDDHQSRQQQHRLPCTERRTVCRRALRGGGQHHPLLLLPGRAADCDAGRRRAEQRRLLVPQRPPGQHQHTQ